MLQDLVQLSSECLLGWKWHIFSGQPVLVLNYPHGQNYLPNIWMNFPCCGLCPLPSILSACTTQERLTPVTEFWREKISPLGLLIMGLDKPSSDCLSSNSTCSCPLTILVTLRWSCSSLSMNVLNWGTPEWVTIVNKCIKQSWPRYWSQRDTTSSHLPPDGFVLLIPTFWVRQSSQFSIHFIATYPVHISPC